jgi:hypothetical protein
MMPSRLKRRLDFLNPPLAFLSLFQLRTTVRASVWIGNTA